MLDIVNYYFMIKVNCVAIYSVEFIIKYGTTDCLKINGLQNIHTLITHLTIGLTEKVQQKVKYVHTVCTYFIPINSAIFHLSACLPAYHKTQ